MNHHFRPKYEQQSWFIMNIPSAAQIESVLTGLSDMGWEYLLFIVFIKSHLTPQQIKGCHMTYDRCHITKLHVLYHEPDDHVALPPSAKKSKDYPSRSVCLNDDTSIAWNSFYWQRLNIYEPCYGCADWITNMIYGHILTRQHCRLIFDILVEEVSISLLMENFRLVQIFQRMWIFLDIIKIS